MRHQEHSAKAAIDAVRTRYLVSHESQNFYRLAIWLLTIILRFLAYEIHPYKVGPLNQAGGRGGKYVTA